VGTTIGASCRRWNYSATVPRSTLRRAGTDLPVAATHPDAIDAVVAGYGKACVGCAPVAGERGGTGRIPSIVTL